jgi:hypothetical protein
MRARTVLEYDSSGYGCGEFGMLRTVREQTAGGGMGEKCSGEQTGG